MSKPGKPSYRNVARIRYLHVGGLWPTHMSVLPSDESPNKLVAAPNTAGLFRPEVCEWLARSHRGSLSELARSRCMDVMVVQLLQLDFKW
jgi:hypothetical protein